MPDRTHEQAWINDYYGQAPFPGGRFVDRVPVDGALQPWAADTVRHVSRRWLGPVNIRAQGVDFHVRYVGIHEHVGSGIYPLHTHPHSEFLVTLSGQGAIVAPDRCAQEECVPGHLAAFPPGCPHQSRWDVRNGEPWRLMIVDFDLAIDMGQVLFEAGETVDLAFAPFYEQFYVRNQCGFLLREDERGPALAILNEIAQALADRKYGVCSDIVAGLLRCISLFSRSIRRLGLANGRNLAPHTISKEAALLRARTLIEQSELLDTADVARAVGMSCSHFAREFKRSFGISPKQYGRDLHLRRATALLSRLDIPIKDVAFQLGYENSSAFSRAFHRQFGESPADCRRRLADASTP